MRSKAALVLRDKLRPRFHRQGYGVEQKHFDILPGLLQHSNRVSIGLFESFIIVLSKPKLVRITDNHPVVERSHCRRQSALHRAVEKKTKANPPMVFARVKRGQNRFWVTV